MRKKTNQKTPSIDYLLTPDLITTIGVTMKLLTHRFVIIQKLKNVFFEASPDTADFNR